MSVIVRTTVPLQEVVAHSGQHMQREGRAVILLEEVAYSRRLDIRSKTNLLEVLRRRAVFYGEPRPRLPLMCRGYRCVWNRRRIY